MQHLAEHIPLGAADRQLPDRARAGRGGRRDHAVELPAAPDRGQGGTGDGRGLHGRAQAERGHAAERRSCSPRSSTRWGSRAGVFNLVTGYGPVVGEAIAAHPGVDMVSFTGSTRAGRRVSELAAATVKKVALELGGKSPNIILDDADLEKAVVNGVQKCYLNSGQTCSALTRMLVPREKLELGRADRRGGRLADGRRRARSTRPRSSARWCPRSSVSACAATSAGASRRARSSCAGGAEPPEGLEQRVLRARRRCSARSRPR